MKKTKGEVIYILQMYKSCIVKVINAYPHLMIDGEEIKWKPAEKGGTNLIGKIDKQSKRYDIETQAKALWKMKEIDKWMSVLTKRQKEVAFWSYINHDYEFLKIEDGYPRYKGLPMKDRDIYSKMTNRFAHTPGITSKLRISEQAIDKHKRNVLNILSSNFTALSYDPIF